MDNINHLFNLPEELRIKTLADIVLNEEQKKVITEMAKKMINDHKSKYDEC